MEKTTTELTNEYIKEHPAVKSCLKKGLINYSSLARLIAKELGIEKKTSKEAILIAARRFHEKLKKEISYETKIKDLLAESSIDIKNKIVVFILEKYINLDNIDEIQKTIRKEAGTFYILEGSDNYTIITQEKYSNLIEKKFKLKIIKRNTNLALINFISPKEVETMVGWLSYVTSLFAENGVNILEFLSCWKDTLFIIDSKDVNKAINFLKF
jgi:aspartokinase